MSNTTTDSNVPAHDLTHQADTGHIRPDASPPGANGIPAARPSVPPKRRGGLGKLYSALVIAGAVIVFVIVRGPKQAEADARHGLYEAYHFIAGPERKEPPKLAQTPPSKTFSGILTVTKVKREAIGMNVVEVEAQTKPILLELNGTTDYDLNTLRKVRPLFDARVTEVFKSTGQMVKKGEPLVELYSTTMAAAKADFRSKYAKWDHDKRFMESRRSLAANSQIPNTVWVDTQLAEQTSRVDYYAAKDKLITYGIPLEEIEKLQANLVDESKPVDDAKPGEGQRVPKVKAAPEGKSSLEDVHDISKLVLYSPIDGMIVERDVVSGNFYDDMAVLMVISPMDKLWVYGNVYEKDQGDVHLGQTWEIQFPYLDTKVEGTVEQIATKVDPATRTLKIRATIPNPDKQLKAEQLVKAVLRIDPVKGQTVIPRNAMAVINGQNCCFIQSKDNPDAFERRIIDIDQENHDFVVVKRGLEPGQMVVTNGTLILSQLFEDESTVSTGLPLQ
jgi:cobalt-zinc-cadmium efflux system membrane fusion protein